MLFKVWIILSIISVLLHRATPQDTISDGLAFAGFAATVAVAIYDLRRELYEIISGQPDMATLGRIAADVRRIDATFERMRNQFSDSPSIFESVNSIHQNVDLELRMEEISEWMRRIDAMYDQMKTYMNRPERFVNASIENFAISCVSHDSEALNSIIESFHDTINVDIIRILNSMEPSLRNVCEYGQSPYQLFHNLMETVILTEIKGFTTMQYAWMLLKIYGHGDFIEEVENSKDKYIDRINTTMLAFKNSLENISREIIRCDAENQIEGETYERITNFRQGYIENEINMDHDEKCDSQCTRLKSAKQRRCTKHTLCEKQPKCDGILDSCREIDRGSNLQMTLCLSSNRSARLYDWVQYDNGNVNGILGKCKTKRYRMDSSWTNFFWRCSYCACICNDKSGPYSDRFFSLKKVVADIKNNKIVTGLRFVKIDRIINLQISQGTLLPNGLVDANTTWIPIERSTLSDQIKDIEYHELSYKERGFDLHDLEGKHGHVLTGVRFKKIKRRLNFQIQTTPFDYKTGQLTIGKSIWIHSRRSRKRVNTDNLDIPTRSRMRSIPNSYPGQYVEFDHTDFELDLAQTTIPYVDVQPVVSANPVPLSGAGVYYKSSTGFGGYIAPKIITYNYRGHMTENFEIASRRIIKN